MMVERRLDSANPKLVKVLAAVVVGLSVGTMVPPDPVALPVVGSLPGLAVGVVGLALGVVLYRWVPALLATSGTESSDAESQGCGCDGECGCA